MTTITCRSNKTSNHDTVRLTVELTTREPWNEDGPYRMIDAGEKIREALARAGYSPR